MKEYLIIYTTRELVHVASDDVVYILAEGNYTTFYLPLGHSILVRGGIVDIKNIIQSQLNDTCNDFIQIGRSVVINRKHLTHINLSKNTVVLSDGISQYYTVEGPHEALKKVKILLENEVADKFSEKEIKQND